jgi:hypothetical protein
MVERGKVPSREFRSSARAAPVGRTQPSADSPRLHGLQKCRLRACTRPASPIGRAIEYSVLASVIFPAKLSPRMGQQQPVTAAALPPGAAREGARRSAPLCGRVVDGFRNPIRCARRAGMPSLSHRRRGVRLLRVTFDIDPERHDAGPVSAVPDFPPRARARPLTKRPFHPLASKRPADQAPASPAG